MVVENTMLKDSPEVNNKANIKSLYLSTLMQSPNLSVMREWTFIDHSDQEINKIDMITVLLFWKIAVDLRSPNFYRKQTVDNLYQNAFLL